MTRRSWLAALAAAMSLAGFVQCTGSDPDIESVPDASTGGPDSTAPPGDGSTADDATDATRERLPPEVLADKETQPAAIAIASGQLWWTSFDGAIRTCTISTCATTKKDLAVPDTRVDGGYDGGTTNTVSILVDATHVYWPAYLNGLIFRCPRDACAPTGPDRWLSTTPGTGTAPVELAMDDANVYFSDYGTPPVKRCAKDTKCIQEGVADGTPFPGPLAVGGPNAEDLFWLSGIGTTGWLSRVKKGVTDAGPSVIDFEIPSPSSLAVDDKNVFFTSTDDADGGANSGAVWKALAVGSPGTTKFAGGLGGPQGVAIDAQNVYWVETTGGRVASCPRAGCAASGPVVLATGEDEPFGLALDATHVYWTTRSGGQVKRVEK